MSYKVRADAERVNVTAVIDERLLMDSGTPSRRAIYGLDTIEFGGALGTLVTYRAHVLRRYSKYMASQRKMATKTKSAMDTLLESMDQLADSAAKNMSAEELQRNSKEINESIDRVVAGGRQRRRETA